jgi:peptide chain release factor 1
MSLEENLSKLLTRYDELQALMTSASGAKFVELSKEFSDLGPIVEEIQILRRLQKEFDDAKAMIESGDADMKAMAEEEFHRLKPEVAAQEAKVHLSLLPKDEADAKNAILEVRAGTGGEEAALFAAELFRMYERYASQKGWKFEIVDLNETGLGGFKEAIANVSGRNVFARLKFESGVHRVQRVPETEGSGRVHTSAATVAVMPEVEEVDIEINPEDLRIETMRSQGSGGQHVNKTESAIRITHIPSGFFVKCQEEKSQHKNRARAMAILRARLYDVKRQALDAKRSADRKSQVGSGDRSERIRTYNFPQGRVTDHRINLTLYNIQDVLEGRGVDQFVDALTAEDQAERLAALT